MDHTDVILVDADDRAVGTMAKLAAHESGQLHRAISVYLFNQAGELLIQRRAPGKYHCGGQWANTCCSHPVPGERVATAASRRLREEMGLSVPLRALFSMIYRVPVSDGLEEHEYLHVFVGQCDQDPVPDPAEADAWQFISLATLQHDMQAQPQRYAPWLHEVLPALLRHMDR
ncbi:isopentenyl-diphosphate Delta-isomerase [Alcanivorax sp. JB21]|uniref:isopentenyl-diphosphate Delta-isomerase n=1 Tax=Alcanivorax limicola TaxID=2874102 RepID=UPI001CBE3274|nr:isopentenyl-diphosphate Delta-isomerase [Alcanivorax limicola]MBZ2188336.1 isopentenyl-diphosphate Delta-isomerase [Alcanivorax limicola]